MTIQQLEDFSNTKPELRYLTEEIIKYMTANPGGGTSYQSYVASLTIVGTNNPTATIFENTLGFVPAIVRDGVGQYYFDGDFGPNAWFVFQSPGAYNSGVINVLAEQLIGEGGFPANIIYFLTATYEPFAPIDDWEAPIKVEIRVYP